MDQGFNWSNIEQNKMPALKFICQQHSIRVNGKTKRDYVKAIAEYRKNQKQNHSFVPPPARPDQFKFNPELQALTRNQRATHTLSDLHHAKTLQRFHDNERRLEMKITPNAFQQKNQVLPPTPPKPARPINFLREPVYSDRAPPSQRTVDFVRERGSSSRGYSSSSSPVSSSTTSRGSSPGDMPRNSPSRAQITQARRRSSNIILIIVLLVFLLLVIL